MSTSPAPSELAETLQVVAEVDGWLTDAQARRLWERAGAVRPGGRIVEIGSYHGRSAIVLARAARDDVEIVAIDPHAGSDRGPREIVGRADEGERDHEAFTANLARAGVAGRVRHVRRPSQEAGPAVAGSVDLLYIDGAHRFAPARSDIVGWGARVADGGSLLIHDSFSSIGVTLALATTLFGGGHFRYVGRVGSLAEYRCQNVSLRARPGNAARQMAQVPWFARNVAIKVVLVAAPARLQRLLLRLLRLLGHRQATWPY